jgi:hypothetical protein
VAAQAAEHNFIGNLVDTISVDAMCFFEIVIFVRVPVYEFIFTIVSYVAGDIVNAVVNLGSEVIDDWIIHHSAIIAEARPQ